MELLIKKLNIILRLQGIISCKQGVRTLWCEHLRERQEKANEGNLFLKIKIEVLSFISDVRKKGKQNCHWKASMGNESIKRTFTMPSVQLFYEWYLGEATWWVFILWQRVCILIMRIHMLKSNQPSHVYVITDWGHYLLHLQHLQHP